MIDALARRAIGVAHRLRHRWRRWRKRPLEGVTMIACDGEGRLLMVRHSYAGRLWGFPGGGIRRGEAPLAAALRELREETGCQGTRAEALGRLEERVSGSPHTAHVFACRTEDPPRPDRREVIEARFFPAHSLPHPVSALTEARLALWRRARRGVTAG